MTDATSENMKNLLEHIVQSITDNPQDVKVEMTEDDTGLINLKLTVHADDMGRVIGKQGKVIKAIRNILRVPAIKTGKRVNIQLFEVGKTQKETPKSEDDKSAAKKESVADDQNNEPGQTEEITSQDEQADQTQEIEVEKE